MWYDKSINNCFVKAINNNIQTNCRMAKGFKNIDYFITMVYLCNGRLKTSFNEVVTVPSAAFLQQF